MHENLWQSDTVAESLKQEFDDELDDVRAGFAEEVKNSLFGGCIRRPIGDLPGPRCLRARRSAKGLPVQNGQAKGEHFPTFYSQYIAPRGACGKTRVVPHNCQPKPEPAEMGGTKCICC